MQLPLGWEGPLPPSQASACLCDVRRHYPTQASLEGRPRLTAAGLGALLAGAPELRDLSLRNAAIATDGLQAGAGPRAHAVRSQLLHTGRKTPTAGSAVAVCARSLQALQGCRTLTGLCLAGVVLTPESRLCVFLANLQSLTHLTHLDLSCGAGLTNYVRAHARPGIAPQSLGAGNPMCPHCPFP